MTRARNLGEIADSSYISAVGNKVGIGSTVPQYTLDVAGKNGFARITIGGVVYTYNYSGLDLNIII